MSFDYIKSYYGVDAKRGQRVTAYGKPGVITGADGQYLRIRLDGQKHSDNYHPTDGIDYSPAMDSDLSERVPSRHQCAGGKAGEASNATDSRSLHPD